MINQPQKTKSWNRIRKRAAKFRQSRISQHATDRSRFFDMSFRIGPLLVDYSKQKIDMATVQELTKLATEMDLGKRVQEQLAGLTMNNTECRKVLHTALRSSFADAPKDVAHDVQKERARMLKFAEMVRSGKYLGHTGKSITHIVHIGIGGSHLGPEFVCQALNRSNINIQFLSNIDGQSTKNILRDLNPETTLVIIVSKTFTTLETITNARAIRSWFLERTGNATAFKKHFVAVSNNEEGMDRFGIADSNRFYLWDWIGGRFSLWSSVGLPLAICIGPNAFRALLRGAASMDKHFQSAPFSRNAPVMLALLTVWNTNFFDTDTHAILVYDQRLRLFVDFLQQLEMESNGKSVHKDGVPVDINTCPIIWGGEETNGQHAYHQLLHQGTRSFATDFIVTVNPEHTMKSQHNLLLANALGQSKMMLQGKHFSDMNLSKHRKVVGDHPSTTILLDELNAESLGYLISLYENKVAALGYIWNINSFDQYGVENGKIEAEQIYKDLTTSKLLNQDASTAGLIETIKSRSL